jgi:hypothetical protein
MLTMATTTTLGAFYFHILFMLQVIELPLLFIELSSHVDNLHVMSYSLPLSILLSFVQYASLVLGCDCIFSGLNSLMTISGVVRQECGSLRL